MANWTDSEFEIWLAALPNLGYPRDWIGRNLPALRVRFERGEQMKTCPLPSARSHNRYEEI
ncbi:hypothetical protein ADT71_03485 [Novosphingobium sp. ST904]|nr:hypothetical protein ADT71_03485 [Novosphingobium sp. ST904]TCM25715.1 hypothetical protein EDF59_13927 [Novosphingobium sp. ST904]